MEIRCKVDGDTEIHEWFNKAISMDVLKAIVKKNGSDLQTTMQEKADFKMGYQTGTTKRSIKLHIEDGGLTAKVGPETEYAIYLEYGTRYMDAQPFIRPALNEIKPKFFADIKKIL